MIRHKFRAKRTECDHRTFASKAEARYYQELKLLKEKGDVLFFLEQIPIRIQNGKIKYICDFLVFYANGECHFVDVKGFPTPVYKLKKKLVEAEYPFPIVEVKK